MYHVGDPGLDPGLTLANYNTLLHLLNDNVMKELEKKQTIAVGRQEKDGR